LIPFYPTYVIVPMPGYAKHQLADGADSTVSQASMYALLNVVFLLKIVKSY
jgi:hypothetical protein